MDDTALHFAQPLWLLVGVVVCAGIVGLFVRFDRRREADLAKLIHPRFRQRLTEGFAPWLRNLKRGMWLVAVMLAFVAIARPQKGFEWHEVKRRGIDILFAVDTSRSMLAEDLTPNRLERARLGILDFVARLNGDRVGLIPFAGSAFALCPLTLDYDAFRESLNALDTDLIPRQGTDLASAIKEAERLFDENGNNHRVLVLLTDGEDLQGDVFDAVKAAAKNGTAIFTVGVGSAGGATMPIHDRFGRTDYVRDAQGQVVRTVLDEATLKKIAEETHGLYVPLGRGAEGLNTIYQEKLRLVPQSELNQRLERIPLERFEWPLGAAITMF
ncbi:MAG: VWA domain-containing protein, partial [Verrucomicrobia bacterium]|nr:VWA domain-containing protein [Verrucomicrobiota bacterium]